METKEIVFLIFFAAISFIVFLLGSIKSIKNNNAYGNTFPLYVMGIFVWGDAMVFGLFWTLASLFSLAIRSWLFFLLVESVFWIVRSFGETIYWFNQQFSVVKRAPAKKLPGYAYLENDSIWFVYQILWQCVTIISIISAIKIGYMWLVG
jgi:hypothetical protein